MNYLFFFCELVSLSSTIKKPLNVTRHASRFDYNFLSNILSIPPKKLYFCTTNKLKQMKQTYSISPLEHRGLVLK